MFRAVLIALSERLYRLAVGRPGRRGGRRRRCRRPSRFGLTQQVWTRPASVSGGFGSMLPCRTRQRNVAWICPAGHPKRSYRSRWRKAVSRSSRHIRPNHPPAEPDAFGVGGRAPQQLGGLGKLVELALAVLLWRRRRCSGAGCRPWGSRSEPIATVAVDNKKAAPKTAAAIRILAKTMVALIVGPVRPLFPRLPAGFGRQRRRPLPQAGATLSCD